MGWLDGADVMAELIPAPNGYPIKLVRDRTPEILNGSGEPGDLFYGSAPSQVVWQFLRLKLAEEVAEFLLYGGADELADVYAVVDGLAAYSGVDLAAMLAADPRGGFRDRVMMYGRHDEFDVALSGSVAPTEEKRE